MNKLLLDIRSNGLKLLRIILSFVIPVKKGKLLFESWPDYSDNSRAFSDYLLMNTNYRLFWSVNNAEKYPLTNRIRFIEKNGGKSFWGRLVFIYHTVSSQYLFSTHGSFMFANRRKQQYIVLWHGMPLKKIANMQSEDNHNYLNNSSYILSTSKYYVPIFQKCFGKEEGEILPLGIPRNDLLFQDNDSLNKLGIEKRKNEKLIIYLPTFRKTSIYDKGDTGVDVFKDSFLNLSDRVRLEELNNYLYDLHLKMLIKPHPSDIHQLNEVKLSNIVIIPHVEFSQKDIQLNHVLHYADALITDFSGVFIDYLNLNRPIGFLLTDLEQYTSNRGFLFDAPLDYMPGKKIYNEDDFEKFCSDISEGIDNTAEERMRLRNVYNDYSDGENSRRLADFLKL